MKKFLYLFLMPSLLLWACNKEQPEPTPEPEPEGKVTLKTAAELVVSDEGETKQAEFSATLDWTAASNANWLTVEPRSGKAGDATIALKAVANTSYDSRKATVTIKSGKDSKTITVTQKQKGALVLVESTLQVAAEGGVINIVAKANSNVTATVDSKAATWIADVTAKGLIDYIFDFEIAANTDEAARSGKIVFSNEAGSETVTIEQAGATVEPPVEEYNIFGQVTCEGVGVPGVQISDGIDIVVTDQDGNYKLQSEKKWKYVFMTVPSGYEPMAEGFLPIIHKPLTGEVSEQEEKNFELLEVENDNYTLLVLGDMHLARRTGDLEQFDKVAEFMKKAIEEAPGKVYALTLGDMTWDMYWVANNYGFTEYIQTMNSYFPNTTFFHTMGNHDNEMEVAGDYLKCLKYTENLTPDYYSFNLGKVHYIVLDDMDFTGVEAGEDNRSKYKKNFTAEQLEWLKKDLSYVDKGTPVFVTAHEPLARPSGLQWNEILNGEDADLDTFIGIFDGYNVRFLSGHTHNIFNKNWTSTFTEHNSGAVCASWWWSGYITPGIHIAQDGTPGGYTVWNVTGTEFTHYYQAALQSPDYQFRAYDMNSVKATITEDLSSHSGYPKYYNHVQGFDDNVILVNVWDYDEDWNVEISENGAPLDVAEVGVYDPLHIYTMTIPRLNKWNTTTFSTAKWCHFFQATASAADTPVTVKVTDRYGNVFTEEMVRPKAFNVGEYKNQAEREKPVAEHIASSSSSLVFGWTIGGTAAEDADVPYTLSLYKDAACTDLQLSFDVPAGSSCWSSKPLRFTFGSLAPATTYYFVVTNTLDNVSSEPVEGTTEEFTVVNPSAVADAAEGDVILAEDFSEIGWGADMLATAAGFIPNGKPLDPLSGNYTKEEGNFQAYDNTAGRIYGETLVSSDKRLFNWGFFGNSSVYAYSGYLRVGSSTSGARTHIVSPALSGIPDGKIATIDVTVTSARYDNISDEDHDVAVFLEDHTALTLVLAPDQKGHEKFSGSGGKYTGATLANGYPLEAQVKKWSTKTVRIEGVTCDNCLLFGSYTNIDTKNRFFLRDVKVEIVSMKDVGAIDQVVEVSDFDSFKAFLSACEPGKSIQADVTADITLTSDQLADIDALYPISEFEGVINGNGHTIAGLTKPLFDIFSGKASNLMLNSTLNITDAQDKVGIFACSVSNSILTECVSKGSVTHASSTEVDGDLIIGGLIGSISKSTLTACHNLANVTNTTTATEFVKMGGLIGVADGGSTLTGTVTEFNYNKSVILENSESEKVAVGGVCGYTSGAASDFAYAQNQVQDGDDVDDIVIKDNTRDKVYVGGIIGMSANTSSFDYASNVDADVCVYDLTMSATGQVFAGGIIGGWSESGEQTITGCSNSGYIYTKRHSDGDKYYSDINVGETATPLWSCFGGIAGMGSGTSEGLNGGVATITGKTFHNCTMSGKIQIYGKVRCCIGGVVAYTENDPEGCVCTNNIRLYKNGGIGTVGENYHRQIVGGVVGYFSGSSATNLKYDGTILTQSSSPYAYTSGIIGYINPTSKAIELNNCRVGGSVRAAGSGGGRNALICHNNTNTVSVTFTNCLIKKGTISYATGSKVEINEDSQVTAGQCMGASDSNYTIEGDVLPTVAESID